MFTNRQQAGIFLGQRLKQFLQESDDCDSASSVIVALPRGGVPVGAEVSAVLACPLDILVSKKMRAPDNPELAIGAVSSAGYVVVDERMWHILGREKEYGESQKQQRIELLEETKHAEQRWLELAGISQRAKLTGSVVILVDDGVATGMTTLAAIRSLKAKMPAKLILAAPVVPYSTYCRLTSECDLIIALTIAYEFDSVGAFYEDFHQVTDEEVVASLKLANQRPPKALAGNV